MRQSTLLFLAVIIASYIVLPILIIIGRRKLKRERQQLKETGLRIYVEVIKIYQDKNAKETKKGQYPYRLRCVYQDPVEDKRYEYDSDYLWTKPKKEIIGQMVPVYVERDNYYFYLMELDEYLHQYL